MKAALCSWFRAVVAVMDDRKETERLCEEHGAYAIFRDRACQEMKELKAVVCAIQ